MPAMDVGVPEAGLHLFLGPAHPQKVCLRLTSEKAARVPDGKLSSGRGDSGHGGSSKATPKKDGKAATANSQGTTQHNTICAFNV